ncbi:LysR family transcriptional regulator [Peribacillus castrilensis]|uniref:LysR family transcriptional regulator n=1 Tax=Peribacillus simplex TaxID=1478 RepID=A0AAN2TSK5_9BACI|nr:MULTISPECIES: LysR family transcriptional regulator [Bacillaceae]MCP1094226.1 LysR family transcriptional regulator [Bacillaceae bacterium OS4b]MBD8589100.1 LysR family transcriptional regulator [Peribacillus simplex]MCF7622311.1 LysR family transcriptional regulator [Peribacillus frigoritolerans]MCP1152882.1 LysR family transcriptional regulator [Peribacillus frigoritolerans]MCT1388673.1 LysR family transcriptional regulator [Peribacillus frigoritolerans]
MKLENLKMFCLVVDEGSISQAARLSFLSQPAVTRQIHQLENYYNTLLFDREEGRLRVTEAGKLLYPFAKAIVNDFNHSKEVIQQSTGKYHANLIVGASLTIGEYLLPSLLGRFKKQQPEIKVTLTIKNTPRVLEDLSNDVIDLALVEGLVENTDFIVDKFAEDELILVCPSDHPWKERKEIQLEELGNERMIWRESISGTRLIVENMLREHGILEKIESYMEIGSTQAIKSAVEAGLGISILPRLTVARELEQGFLREVDIYRINMARNLWLVRKNKRFNKIGVSKFVDFLQ